MARPFALGQVELLDSPFRAAMGRNAKYLLALDAGRLLHKRRGKSKVTVRFQARPGNFAGGLFGARMLKRP